jgi:hypothetical protein
MLGIPRYLLRRSDYREQKKNDTEPRKHLLPRQRCHNGHAIARQTDRQPLTARGTTDEKRLARSAGQLDRPGPSALESLSRRGRRPATPILHFCNALTNISQ